MNGTYVLGFVIVAALAILAWDAHRQERRRQERLDDIASWHLILSLEPYGYHAEEAPDFVPEWMEREAA